MQGFITFFFVASVFVTVAVAVSVLSASKINSTLQQLASRYGGTLSEAGLWQSPSVRFMYRDAHVLLDYFSTGGKQKTHYTQIKIYGQVPNVRCEVYPEGFWTNLRRLIGIQDITIGYPQFDADYVIKGSNEQSLRSLLTPTVQISIERLRQLIGNGDIYVSVSHGVLHVRKLSRIRDLSTLDLFVKRSLQLYDMLTSASGDGIQFVEQSEVEVALAEAICQVCGEVIREDVVLCSKCRTPHHRECWLYFGACSTYGCRERKFRQAK